MPGYYAIGTALVTRDELVEKEATGQIDVFVESLRARPETAALEFSTGVVTADNLKARSTLERSAQRAGFEPIGMNKPLAIEIRHIYTGQYPKLPFFNLNGGKDLLVTSAIKNLTTSSAAPRAVNLLRSRVTPASNISTPAATDQGTPLIYYTPALVDSSHFLTLDLVFDTFPDAFIEGIANIFTKAGGIPIFALQSVYLLGAGMVINLLGRAMQQLLDGRPVFSGTTELSFDRPGSMIPEAKFVLITDHLWDKATLDRYDVNDDGQLADVRSGELYTGPLPYVVISLDGRERKNYEEFTATVASAALLERFFNITEGQDQPLDLLIDALQIYNDWQYRQRADQLAQQRNHLTADSDAYKKLTEEYQGLVANIQNEALKPK